MKPHRILKSFKGSQTGHDHHEFKAGTTVPLSNDLASIVVKEGWAEPHIQIKPRQPADGEMLEEGQMPDDAKAEVGLPIALSEVGENNDEEKAMPASPANKMKKSAPENKGKR